MNEPPPGVECLKGSIMSTGLGRSRQSWEYVKPLHAGKCIILYVIRFY